MLKYYRLVKARRPHVCDLYHKKLDLSRQSESQKTQKTRRIGDTMVVMGVLDWIYPKKCVGCEDEGAYICDRCKGKIVRKGESLAYDSVVRQVIKEIKYRGTYDMVREVVALWRPCKPSGEWVVTSVPMWVGKKKIRGYNQAELIAREVARSWGTPYAELLTRVRETRPMYGLARGEREANVRGAFRVNVHQLQMTNVHQIILVDDVYTSGATTSECCRVLTKAGMEKIKVITLAR